MNSTPSKSSFVLESGLPWNYVTLYYSRVVLEYYISPVNHLFMKCPHPIMKYPKLLMSEVIFAANI